MKTQKNPARIIGVLGGLALSLASGLASAMDYTYLDGGFVSIDRGNRNDSGIRLGGSITVAPTVALIGEYADADSYSQFSGGALFHTPINRDLDLVLGGTFEQVDLGPVDDTGFGLRGGVRWQPSGNRFELNPEVRVLDVFNRTDTSFHVGANFAVAPHFDVGGAVQAGDDDRLEFGLRYRFGP